jgi:hypothetical protein
MSHIDQSSSTVTNGDMVAGNKLALDLRRPAATSKIEALKARLIEEMKNDPSITQVIDELKEFHNRRPAPDGINGLEAKLKAGNREFETNDALEQKEMFAKLLVNFSMYVSAQEIFAHLLSRAVQEFRSFIQPNIESLDITSYNALVNEKIVKPLVDEVGDSSIRFNDLVSMGVYYWLAEQCFVRWHR